MTRSAPSILAALVIALVVIVGMQARALLVEEEPLADLAAVLGDEASRAGATTATAVPAATPPPLPEAYKVIDTSAIFGSSVKPPPQPALLGIVDRYAIIRAPDGKVELVAEGGELGGVKVVRIGTNRVLIEHQGKTSELNLFAGLGSAPLVVPGKETKP